MNALNKITKSHLQKLAIVYVRQSTQTQLLKNKQSLELQYALCDKAKDYGWDLNNIQIIDADLGISGSTKENREGFKNLLLKVSSGEVGSVFSYDATRLSRNCGDWYSLLDICGYKDTLIGDTDGVYDPSDVNDRLLLGLKGQLAEFELKTIKSRMLAGKMHKVKKGELYLDYPSGYVKSPLGKIEIDPNKDVYESVKLVFETFRAKRTVAKTLQYFVDNSIELPRKNHSSQIVWKKATSSSILQILKNPTYAGVYVYGKSKVIKDPSNGKQYRSNQESWDFMIVDNHPAYIDFNEYKENQKQIKNNYAEYQNRVSSGVPRTGKALLHGIVYCGHCGHKMYVIYRNKYFYSCTHSKRARGVSCKVSVDARPIDEVVSEAFMKALSPVEIDAYNRAIENNNRELDKAKKIMEKKLQRKKYEAGLREKQYMAVDPENRLVASTLEENWEKSLLDLEEVEKELEEYKGKYNARIQISLEDQLIFKDIGKRLPSIWSDQSKLPINKKKELIRSLIEKINIIREINEICLIRIVWKGGFVSELPIPMKVNSFKDLSNYDELVERLRQLHKEGFSDKNIAKTMTQEGYRSTSRFYLSQQTIKSLRLKLGLFNDTRGKENNELIRDNYFTVKDIMNMTGKCRSWVHYHISNKNIEGVKSEQKHNIYLFPKSDDFVDKVKRLGRQKNEQKVEQQ